MSFTPAEAAHRKIALDGWPKVRFRSNGGSAVILERPAA